MTAPDRDPTALAREVLDNERVRDSTPGTLYLDGPTHEHEEAASAILDAAPTLARAVIELTARLDAERFAHANAAMRIKCVKALADQLDREADRIHVRYMDMGDHAHGLRDAYREDAKRIRAALDGGNK